MKTVIIIVGVLILLGWVIKRFSRGYAITLNIHNATAEKLKCGTGKSGKTVPAFSSVSFENKTSDPDIEAILRFDLFNNDGRVIGRISGYHNGGNAHGAGHYSVGDSTKISHVLIQGDKHNAEYDVFINEASHNK